MAYRRTSRRAAPRRSSARRSVSRSTRRVSSARPRARRAASGRAQTLRIVLEQPGSSAIARPNVLNGRGVAQAAAAAPRRARF